MTKIAVETSHCAWQWDVEAELDDAGTVVVSVQSCGQLNEQYSGPVAQFCIDGLVSGGGDAPGPQAPIKLLLPTGSGFVLQADFLERRMVDCLDVARVKSFLTCGQHVQGHAADAYRAMPPADLLRHCYGALILEPSAAAAAAASSSSSSASSSSSLHNELANRLSFPWLSTTPVPRKRLAFVGAAPLCKFRGYAVAAASLGIALVVLDVPRDNNNDDGGGGELDQYTRLCESYVPLDTTAAGDGDGTLVRRLVSAVAEMQNRGVRFDGIMSVDEHLLGVVAQAAVMLDMPTSPPNAVALAQNKFQTRQLLDTTASGSASSSSSSSYSRLVSSPAELRALLADEAPPRPYPLIVKPCKGWSSEGVWRVTDDAQLAARISALWEDLFADWHGRHVVVESYVDGPEVDANMALVDGQIVFFEVNDDFPSSADVAAAKDYDDDGNASSSSSSSSAPVTFVETCNMIPSALPAHELHLLRQRLHETALAVGFRDGILHMEARIRNSSCHFTKAADQGRDDDDDNGNNDDDDLVDLHPKTTPCRRPPSSPSSDDIFLIEINPRPPGWQEVEATARAYGVSYYALALLAAAGDHTRFAALAQPFRHGAQYHMQLLFVSAQRGGIFRWPSVCETVLARHRASSSSSPSVPPKAHVVQSVDLMQPGQEVPDPRSGKVFGSFIAFFLVVSRHSRRDALALGREIEREVRVVTEGF